MAAKVDESSSVDSRTLRSTVPANSPKVSMFGAKSGFFIPKNKLSGSMVLRGGTKHEAGSTPKDEGTKQIQRKTRWGVDLTMDPSVRKGRALAYQTRLEQINKQLKSRQLDTEVNEEFFSLEGTHEYGNTRKLIDLQAKSLKQLDLEKREIIGEILQLNSGYKAPADYKPLVKEATVPVPVNAHSGFSFLGLLLGPESNAQKRLEDETGAKIRVYGTKKSTRESHELTQADNIVAHDAYEDLYVSISADTYEKVDAAVGLLELLLAPISVNSTASSGTTTVSSAVSSADVNPVILGQQPVLVSPQPTLSQFRPFSAPWPPNAQPNHASSETSSQVHPPFGPFTVNAFPGQHPGQGLIQRAMPGPPGSTPLIQPPQATNARPAAPLGIQQLPIPSRPPLNVRPMPTHSGPGSWSLPPRPTQMPSPLAPIRPPISVSPVTGFTGLALPVPNPQPQQNAPTFGGQHFPTSAGPFPSQPSNSLPSLTPMPPPSATSVSAQGPPFHGSNPVPMQTMPSVPAPLSASTGSAPVSELAQSTTPHSTGAGLPTRPALFTPLQGPAVSHSAVQPVPAQGFGSVPGAPAAAMGNAFANIPPLSAPRPVRSVSGDFTFQPPGPTGPAPGYPRPQMEPQAAVFPPSPVSSFRPLAQNTAQPPFGGQGFQRPPGGNQMGFPQQMARMQSDFSVQIPQNPSAIHPPPRIPPFQPNSVRPFTATFPSGLPNFPPSGPMPNLSHGALPHPGQFLQQRASVNPGRPGGPMFHQEQFGVSPVAPMPARMPTGPGGNQSYDPFLPTAIAGAPRNLPNNPNLPRKSEADPEYEDLMASVGVK